MKTLKKIFFYLIVTALCFEVALWVVGYRPYQMEEYKISSTPSHPFIADSVLGISLNPGKYEIILNDSLIFNTTHLENGQRSIPFPPNDSLNGSIHLYGCSFTYGYGVNDDESFAYLLQRQFLNYQVSNHAVIGYGTCQSLLQLQSISDLKAGDVALLVFSKFHFERNYMSYTYRKSLQLGYGKSNNEVEEIMTSSRFPFCSEPGKEIEWLPWKDFEINQWGRNYSNAINFFYAMLEINREKHIDPVGIAAYLISEMHAFCEQKGVQFGLVVLDESDNIQKLRSQLEQVPQVSVQFDFENPDLTNAPYDTHPNEIGHQFIFNQIKPFIQSFIKSD